MKIDILSDLHVDFWKSKWRSAPGLGTSDVLICAGDAGELISTAVRVELAWLCKQYKKVYYVAGNHDSYSTTFGYAEATLRELQKQLPNLIVLRTGEIHQLSDYKIIGDTGWMPDHLKLLKYPINDLKLIKEIRPAIHEHHSTFREFLMQEANENTIIVMHHVPSWSLVAPQFIGDPYNNWFVGDIEDIIKEKKPKYCIFGHTHHPSDSMLYNTRMICQPLGYPSENWNGPKGVLTIDI